MATQLTIDQAIELALRHHRAGELVQAEQIYRQILTQNPNHARVLHLLGVIAHQAGHNQPALDLIRKAISIEPGDANYHSNLGIVLAALGESENAVAAFREAIRLSSRHSEAHNKLGEILLAQNQFEPAMNEFSLVLEISPDNFGALNNLGIAQQELGKLDEAMISYQRAREIKPDLPEVHDNIASVLRAQGNVAEAIVSIEHAIRLRPLYFQAYSALGDYLRERGKFAEAVSACKKSIELNPRYAIAHNNLGNTLAEQGKLDEALAAFQKGVEIKPNFVQAHSNRGNLLKDCGRLDEALEAYETGMSHQPGNATNHSNYLYALHFHPRYDAPTLLREHRKWNERHARNLQDSFSEYRNDPDPNRRLRIGYVSPDFRGHPIGRFLLPLLQNHDRRDEVEIFCYSDVIASDALTQKIRAGANFWHSIVGLSHQQVDKMIHDDRIDILVDLTMHSADNRLLTFAHKPAPIQVSYLAYCSTTGLDAIDYRLTDPYLDPPGEGDANYSEKSIRLPRTYWCYQPPMQLPEITEIPEKTNGFITFGCLNNFSKVSPNALRLWAQILSSVPNSQLILFAKESSHRRGTLELFTSAGIAPTRIDFVPAVATEEYFRTWLQIDIALDPFPCAGGTTTCDALWMGVPVITLKGQTAVGRTGVSILSNIGLPELVADTPEKYTRIAIDLATDPNRLEELKLNLRKRMLASPLCDADRFARDVEDAYRQMWRQWRAQAEIRKSQ